MVQCVCAYQRQLRFFSFFFLFYCARDWIMHVMRNFRKKDVQIHSCLVRMTCSVPGYYLCLVVLSGPWSRNCSFCPSVRFLARLRVLCRTKKNPRIGDNLMAITVQCIVFGFLGVPFFSFCSWQHYHYRRRRLHFYLLCLLIFSVFLRCKENKKRGGMGGCLITS